jgi:hypothetical protein
MHRWLRILLPNWAFVPLTIMGVIAVGNVALTSGAVVASATCSYALSGDRQVPGPIWYWVDERFSAPEIAAIRAGFAAWQSDPSSDIAFVFMGTTRTPDRAVDDGRNVVVRSAGPLLDVPSPTALATTERVVIEGTPIYRDTDVVLDFSGRVPWSTDGDPRAQDLQSLMTHEVGHMLGLDHVTDPDQVMYPVCAPGRVDRRVLQWGDRAALAAVYPMTDRTAIPATKSQPL